MVQLLNDEERLERAARSLRNMIRDKRELNHLLAGQLETRDEELKQAIMHALLDWNRSPPHIGNYTLATHPNKFLLLQYAAIQVLISAGIWHSREHMPSSDGGTSADDHAKFSEYQGWIQNYYADYERKKSDEKTADNIAAAYGNMGLPSEYGATMYIYGEWW